MDYYHYLFKFIIVGDSNTGKSCLLLKYSENQFRKDHEPTIGVEFGAKIFQLKDKTIKIQIWDTVQINIVIFNFRQGKNRSGQLQEAIIKGQLMMSLFNLSSSGAILLFDITSRESFYNILKWRQEVEEYTHDRIVMILVGNKIDLEKKRKVSFEEATQFAEQNKMMYYETSAKTGQNINKIFFELSMKIYEYIETNTIDFTNDVLKNIGIKEGNIQKQETMEIKVQKTNGGCIC